MGSLTAVLEELRDRELELKEAISELQKTKATLRNAFQQAVGGAPAPAAGAKASPRSSSKWKGKGGFAEIERQQE